MMQCRSSPSSHEGPPSRCLDPTISVSPWRRVVVVKTLRIHTALTFAQTPARGVAPALQAPSGGLGDYPPPVRSSEVWHSPLGSAQPAPPPLPSRRPSGPRGAPPASPKRNDCPNTTHILVYAAPPTAPDRARDQQYRGAFAARALVTPHRAPCPGRTAASPPFRACSRGSGRTSCACSSPAPH